MIALRAGLISFAIFFIGFAAARVERFLYTTEPIDVSLLVLVSLSSVLVMAGLWGRE